MKLVRLLIIVTATVGLLRAQAPREQAASASIPASMRQMIVPSHGSMLLGVFYLAAGAGPHPTAIILHGFPGFEQNLDLAQTMRAHGWNVLAMHYRGSWGVKGDFSFAHAAEDADTEVQFILDPENARKYRVDMHRVVVIGHSMGGYMAASAIAHNPQLAGAVLISAWNIGAEYENSRLKSGAPTIEREAKDLEADNNLLPLAGTSGEALAREIYEHQSALNFNHFASAIGSRPVLVVTANDGLASSDQAFVEALRKAGNHHVIERHWDTDHSYSGERQGLANAILQWAEQGLQ